MQNRERRLAAILPLSGAHTFKVAPMMDQKWMIIIAFLALLSLTLAAASFLVH
jgi:hypothetical protein